jgi:hypothetical protein
MKWGDLLIGACCALFVVVVLAPTGLWLGIGSLFGGRDAPAWVQAFGSIAAILLTGLIAVGGWLGELNRRAEADHTKVFVAERINTQFHELLTISEQYLGGGYGGEKGKVLSLSGHQARWLLSLGPMREAMQAADELKPAEMPTAKTAEAMLILRTAIRAFHGRCELQAEFVASGSTIDFGEYLRGSGQAWSILQPEVQLMRKPLTPRWLYDMRRARRHRELEAARRAEPK